MKTATDHMGGNDAEIETTHECTLINAQVAHSKHMETYREKLGKNTYFS